MIGAAVLASSVLFFVLTNLGVWATSGLYPRTRIGLVTCYTAALPFFRNALAGDAIYAPTLFGDSLSWSGRYRDFATREPLPPQPRPRGAQTMARRIVSFLPSATEMVYALELEDQLFGVTHECDYPPAAREKLVVVSNVLPVEEMSQCEIDTAVSARLRNGLSLYQVDEARIRDIRPDLILTQELCQVCAPSGNEVAQLLASLSPKPKVIWLRARSAKSSTIFGRSPKQPARWQKRKR